MAATNHADWQQFVMHLGSLDADAVEVLFRRHGAAAVTLTDAGDEPLLEPAPGETPLWSCTKITGLFSPELETDELRRDICSAFGLAEVPQHEVVLLAGRDWEREWLKDFRPMQFGDRLWVCPGDHEVDARNAVVVRIDPGLAFGTGTHATTALCLAWLDQQDLLGKKVLDFGCGSGILAIAALKLGAGVVTGVDIDRQAIVATRRNAERNQVSERLETAQDGTALQQDFDVVVANILAMPLIDHASKLCALLKSGGRIALSGILDAQVDAVQTAYARWIQFETAVAEGEWVHLSGSRV